jgi:hypothetical protein
VNFCRIFKNLTGDWKCGYYTNNSINDYEQHSGSSEKELIDWARKKGFYSYFVGYSSKIIKL